jgi:hypothetical protein
LEARANTVFSNPAASWGPHVPISVFFFFFVCLLVRWSDTPKRNSNTPTQTLFTIPEANPESIRFFVLIESFEIARKHERFPPPTKPLQKCEQSAQTQRPEDDRHGEPNAVEKKQRTCKNLSNHFCKIDTKATKHTSIIGTRFFRTF